jgi:ABC-type Na+ efflux pump permease subunit
MKIFGYILVTLGGLWTLLAGGCTLVFLANMVGSAGGGGAFWATDLPMVLIFGAVGIVPGALILWAGLAILKGERTRRAAGSA